MNHYQNMQSVRGLFRIAVATCLFITISSESTITMSQTNPEINYDEQAVPDFNLPDPLIASDGNVIDSVKAWETRRRDEVLALFQEHVYGSPLPDGINVSFEEVESGFALDGKASRKQILISCERKGRVHGLQLLLYLPAHAEGPVPVFVGLNFHGNHTVHADPEVRLTGSWVRNDESEGIIENRASERSRGSRSSRWVVETIIESGFGLATMYYGDIDPDFDDGFRNGIHGLYDEAELSMDEMTSITAWAWGLSRIVDYLETDKQINSNQIVVLGHSRLGKTSLWAGASDPRFSIVISNNSGCGGAALSRRSFGETVQRINDVFPHWFCKRFSDYNGNESACPVDQHMLIALMAPRPVYIASASEDRWADPRGEFLAARNADPVYNLYGLTGIETDIWPEPDRVGTTIGYHLRTGAHDVTTFDWIRFIRFAQEHFEN